VPVLGVESCKLAKFTFHSEAKVNNPE
jgi:hypothetical protein